MKEPQAKACLKKDPELKRGEGPAVETALHVWNRPATDREMRPITGTVACRKWTPLFAQFNQGKLAGGSDKYDATARVNAGEYYEKLWDAAQEPGRDSTQAMNISRSVGAGGISQERSDAIRDLVAIESHLGQRDRIIIRMVCGQRFFPSEAVRTVCNDYKDSVTARFRESLDSLIEAIEAARRAPKRFNMEVKS